MSHDIEKDMEIAEYNLEQASYSNPHNGKCGIILVKALLTKIQAKCQGNVLCMIKMAQNQLSSLLRHANNEWDAVRHALQGVKALLRSAHYIDLDAPVVVKA